MNEFAEAFNILAASGWLWWILGGLAVGASLMAYGSTGFWDRERDYQDLKMRVEEAKIKQMNKKTEEGK